MRRQAAEAKTNSGFTNGMRAGAFSESLPQRCGFGLALQGLARGRSPRNFPEALGARLRSNFLRIPAAEAPGRPASARRRRCRRRVGSGARSPSSARWHNGERRLSFVCSPGSETRGALQGCKAGDTRSSFTVSGGEEKEKATKSRARAWPAAEQRPARRNRRGGGGRVGTV